MLPETVSGILILILTENAKIFDEKQNPPEIYNLKAIFAIFQKNILIGYRQKKSFPGKQTGKDTQRRQAL
ncbi:MAG: hypothetical protein HDT27_05125 [Subdoligranulum sp.]|nr:hypothetical protein [Subdoligranulum sp.]